MEYDRIRPIDILLTIKEERDPCPFDRAIYLRKKKQDEPMSSRPKDQSSKILSQDPDEELENCPGVGKIKEARAILINPLPMHE
ncbi:hypothetical protein NPIL_540441 [Nephila pilipes]|uniref:Uncharacterized protein n=1 Tax=Nephila pilipes TaxID=299642 RepID=A0A8X6U4C9_NEPPI|nr:hypothetical protein NPIL_540441 [Nephila pilipes]